MKKMKRIFAIVLSMMLAACGCAAAETVVTPSEAPLDMEAMIGGKIYTFACTLEELEEQGVRISEEELKEDCWHSANNGRAAFEVLLQGTKGESEELSVAGAKFVPDGNQVFTMPGGIVVGQSTKEDCIAAYGETNVGTTNTNWFKMARDKVQYRVSYDEDMVVKEFQLISEGPLSWGFEFDGQAGAEQTDLPDPTAMAFDEYILDGKLYKGQITLADLEANGWVLDHSADLESMIEPQGDKWLVINPILVMYNGESTLQVFPINRSTEEERALGECEVLYIGVNEADGVSLVLADGLTIGCAYSDVETLFGKAGNIDEYEEEGYTYYEHEVMGGITYGFSVYDGIVKYIRVKP